MPRPHANVIGDEILELTGSDTDYSIFTNRGFLPGYDFAFYLDGYNYHTLIDRPSIVEQGALQHLGENCLALSREILIGRIDLQKPETIIDDKHYIYFDVLGRHLIAYSLSTPTIIQGIFVGLIFLIGFLVIIIDHVWPRRNLWTKSSSMANVRFNYCTIQRIAFIFIFLICYLLSLAVGLLLSIIIAFIMSKTRPLSWFGNSTLAIFLYTLPCLIGIIAMEMLWAVCRRWSLSKWPLLDDMEKKLMNTDKIDRCYFDFERHWALLLVYAIVMICSISLGYRSLYIILVWSVFVCPIYLLLILIEYGLRWTNCDLTKFFNNQQRCWTIVPYIVSFIPLIHSLEMSSRMTRLTIPMMSRMFDPLPIPQDVLISGLVTLPAILFFLIHIPNMQRKMHFGHLLVPLIISFLIVIIVACTRNPFNSTHPKIVVVRDVTKVEFEIKDVPGLVTTIPLSQASPSITVTSYDSVGLAPILDQFSAKTGLPLLNRQCITKTKCIFNNTLNRTTAFQEVQLISHMNSTKYTVIFRHESTYQIDITTISAHTFIVQNANIKPRNETTVLVDWFSGLQPFTIAASIERCNIDDSPFLVLLTQTMPNVVMWGSGRCQTIKDTVSVTVLL